jgi:hypothetical protein
MMTAAVALRMLAGHSGNPKTRWARLAVAIIVLWP